LDYAAGNPQYLLEIKRKDASVNTKVVMSLGQIDGRLFHGEKYPYDRIMDGLLVCIFKIPDNKNKLDK